LNKNNCYGRLCNKYRKVVEKMLQNSSRNKSPPFLTPRYQTCCRLHNQSRFYFA
jgi:hypothetical protein